MDNAREVIAALGGLDAVSALTGRKYVTVSAWQTRIGRFPPSTFVMMTEALAAGGYTAPESLWGQIGRADDPSEWEAANA